MMNDVSSDMPRPDAARDLSALLAQQAATPAQTDELARNFLARVQRDIDEQVDLRVQQQLGVYTRSTKGGNKISDQELGLVLGSLGISIPIVAAAGFFGGLPGIIVYLVALAIINVAWSRR
jgi:hypothetical protein